MGSGLGGPGVIIMLTSDRKEYVIGQEGFERDWLHPEHTFPFMVEAFSEKSDNWIRISKNMHQKEFTVAKNCKVRLTM